MPSPEQRGGNEKHEQEPRPYYQAARFAGEKPAGVAYNRAQETTLTLQTVYLSAFRIQFNHIWQVVVLGDPPAQDLEQKLLNILSDEARLYST